MQHFWSEECPASSAVSLLVVTVSILLVIVATLIPVAEPVARGHVEIVVSEPPRAVRVKVESCGVAGQCWSSLRKVGIDCGSQVHRRRPWVNSACSGGDPEIKCSEAARST